ncbi:MAG: prepilin-type N-terminal cleavage/methylation domain-containing protein [Candidatus Edwardsbacteria bacterium]|nr:prepilin-type N-terminal cleavage/methylation domain-containing protein [Candidatus Edwardsbacteria bacterium]MBU1575590.1 prepilin-type N-terminal cleavage/methylation domain-containing protein [Candidatus Edwardsbacteria bacterium]MBU2463538.1 prepilin-type N-terminal cleavage/methylation domain-containing protein [Candidatus Edwardsbacteria bacterium]MBU2593855.1 prepilin-type N-terminal cleavage/methylation domain-containing protein [Candidatus Edwardsbacteria bacterium]
MNNKGFTLIELMIVVVIIGILAAIAIPNFMSMQDRAKEGSVKANMHTIQLAVEDFSTQTEGLYPQDFLQTVAATNPNVPANLVMVAGVAGATVALPGNLLPNNLRNPVDKTIGWAFASGPAAIAVPPVPPVTIVPAAAAPLDQGSVDYSSADNTGAAAALGNATMYVIFGCGVKTTLPNPVQSGQ